MWVKVWLHQNYPKSVTTKCLRLSAEWKEAAFYHHQNPVLLPEPCSIRVELTPPPSPIHTENHITFLQSFVTTHRGSFPCISLGNNEDEEALLHPYSETTWPQEILVRCHRWSRHWHALSEMWWCSIGGGMGREIGRLRHFKSPDEWFTGDGNMGRLLSSEH